MPSSNRLDLFVSANNAQRARVSQISLRIDTVHLGGITGTTVELTEGTDTAARVAAGSTRKVRRAVPPVVVPVAAPAVVETVVEGIATCPSSNACIFASVHLVARV